MQYRAKYAVVEALPVTLDGHERMVFSSGGQFHILPVDLFELLYVHAPAVGPAPEAPPLLAEVARKINKPAEQPVAPAAKRNGRPRNSDPPREKPEIQPRPTGVVMIDGIYPESISHATFLAIKEAPRTSHEVCDRVIAAFPAASRGTVQGYISQLVTAGQAVRRDDMNQITKLYLVNPKAAE